ncbi:MAG: ABC transporter permease subunit [Pseudomonadota bacterium]
MREMTAILKRELAGYFATPQSYVFIVIFLFATGVFTFNLGGFFESGQADLRPFFNWHPWLYLFLVPAISMRLWAEERKTGTLEVLMSLPIPVWSMVLGKFLGAWIFAGVALALTFPIWITVNYLGDPDNGVIFASYVGSLLMAGAYLAIGSCLSAVTSNQVIAFVVSVTVCFLFLAAGLPLVLDFFSGYAPSGFVQAIAGLSFLAHFTSIMDGVIRLRDILFFATLIFVWLSATAVLIDYRRQG